ncbi:hypothetical protein SteCoe_6889 [Stentor coeruleus]|uniref:Cation efflux protein transmembrane domain-containing protein n=1 Tax=Stentor coeruleus TaxID=5963 RepID=A0A1R2CP05_9CILI|nr:hypothetical protein SteCoe_6889 [Stentor coeruleus]
MLARSLKNSNIPYDFLSYPSKLLNYIYQPSGAFDSELTRVTISLSAHFINLLSREISKKKPDEIYNYGYERFSSITSCIPALCYVTYGVKHIMLPFITEVPALEITGGLWLLCGLGCSLAIDTLRLIMVKNSNFFAGANLAGSSIAFITGLLMQTQFPSTGNIFGEIASGTLQCYMGYYMLNNNINILAGRSINQEEVHKINSILYKIPGVLKVDEVKTNPISKEKYKFCANITFDNYKIQDIVYEKIRRSNRTIINKDYEKQIENICRNSVNLTLNKTAEIASEVESDIKTKFPQAKHIQIVGEYKLFKN